MNKSRLLYLATIISLVGISLLFLSSLAHADQTGLMPNVNTALNITPAIGYSTLRVKPATELPLATGGAFRIVCTPSHMSNDDPLVFQNQQGAAHHHTFYGNTSTNYASDVANMAIIGNSTCKGGLANRSSYWVPSMIDTATNKAIVPQLAIFYYKTGRTPAGLINVPPPGLRMLTGNGKATSALDSKANYTCLGRTPAYGWKRSIPVCNMGETMQMKVEFPQCWDGINLDSPDHKAHMAFTNRFLTTANKCPTTHPVAIPDISVNFNYKTVYGVDMSHWRLSSDNYVGLGGYSAHADWVNGWNATIMQSIVTNCLNKGVDCHASLLGNGTMIY